MSEEDPSMPPENGQAEPQPAAGDPLVEGNSLPSPAPAVPTDASAEPEVGADPQVGVEPQVGEFTSNSDPLLHGGTFAPKPQGEPSRQRTIRTEPPSHALHRWTLFSLLAFALGGMWVAAVMMPLPNWLHVAFMGELGEWPFSERETMLIFAPSSLVASSLLYRLLRRWNALVIGPLLSMLIVVMAGYLLVLFGVGVLMLGMEEWMLDRNLIPGESLRLPGWYRTLLMSLEFWMQNAIVFAPLGIVQVLVLRLVVGKSKPRPTQSRPSARALAAATGDAAVKESLPADEGSRPKQEVAS